MHKQELQSLLFLLHHLTLTSWLSNIDDEKVFILLILIGIGTSWAYFIRTILQSHFRTPSIIEKNHEHYYRPKSNSNTGSNNDNLLLSHNATPSADLPLVSIIIPARNEQDNIEKCLSSLVSQSYQNKEIIVVDDNSDDQTLAIMERWQSVKVPFVTKSILALKEKPEGWTGKTWASQQGYLRSHGDVLLFTDADCYYTSKDAIALTVEQLLKDGLDVLTGVPNLPPQDFWSKVVIPVWNIFLEAFGNNISKVNSPRSKVAYVMGCFFMIKRDVFEKIGAFKGVRQDIQEDRAMGNVLKKNNYQMRMYKIDTLVSAKWSRDVHTLWHGIGRTLAPQLLSNDKHYKIVIQPLIFFLLALLPFIILAYNVLPVIIAIGDLDNNSPYATILPMFPSPSYMIDFWLDIALCIAIIIAVSIKNILAYRLMPLYALFATLGIIFLIVAYIFNLSSFLLSNNIKPFVWRGRAISLS